MNWLTNYVVNLEIKNRHKNLKVWKYITNYLVMSGKPKKGKTLRGFNGLTLNGTNPVWIKVFVYNRSPMTLLLPKSRKIYYNEHAA